MKFRAFFSKQQFAILGIGFLDGTPFDVEYRYWLMVYLVWFKLTFEVYRPRSRNVVENKYV